MRAFSYLGRNYVKAGDTWIEREDLPLNAKLRKFGTCARCGTKRACKYLTRVDAPVCISETTMALCKTCLGAAYSQGLIRNGRFRLQAICNDHYHSSQEG